MSECPDCDGKGRAAAPPTWVAVECATCLGSGAVSADVARARKPTDEFESVKTWRAQKHRNMTYAWPGPPAAGPGAISAVAHDRNGGVYGPVVALRPTFEEALEAALGKLAANTQRAGKISVFSYVGKVSGRLVFDVEFEEGGGGG